MAPRFYVHTLGGYGGGKSTPYFYVLDRWYCHRTVGEFGLDGVGGHKGAAAKYRQRKAEELCDQLNAEHERDMAG